MENTLILKLISEEFINKFGYCSKKVTFFDPTSNLEKELYIHKGHAGDFGIWRKIDKFGYKSIFFGEIKIIPINEDLIRSVRAYKNAKILNFQLEGNFLIFKYIRATERRNLELALKNQIWQYVESPDVLFDPYELPEERNLI